MPPNDAFLVLSSFYWIDSWIDSEINASNNMKQQALPIATTGTWWCWWRSHQG